MTKNAMQHVISGAKGGGKGGGGAGRVAVEAPNTLQSKAVLRTVEILSEGEIEGLVDGAKSIYFDDTPLQNSDGTYNFEGVSYELRNGTPDQAHLSGFRAVEATTPVGVEIEYGSPVVRTITDADTDAVVVTVRLPSLSYQDPSTGDLNGAQVRIKIEYQPNGGSYIQAVDSLQGKINGKTTSPYEKQFRFNLTGDAPWNIRVTRVSAAAAGVNLQNDVYWSAYTTVIDHKLTYPDWAVMGLTVDTALFGSDIPNRRFRIKGIKIQIPSNYDPITREYTGAWDGTFDTAWSNNPAWVLYDLITNTRYGLGDYIDATLIDKYTLYTIGQYCDELVPDGNGGEEPRYTFNYAIETQEDAINLLQMVASVFRGMIYWGAEGASASLVPTADMPGDAVKLFTNANVIDGIFSYSGLPSDGRHAAAFATWFDPDTLMQPAIEVVESPSIADMRVYRKMDVVAYGSTSRGQAHRHGKWMLDNEDNADQIVVFGVGLADADTRPGQIAKILDSAVAAVRYGGRVTTATTTQITLDAAVVLASGETYTIDVVLPDGSIESRNVTNSPGSTSVINLSSALSATPAPMTMWGISGSDVAPREFRVLDVTERSPAQYEITAVLHDPTKYARVEDGINLPTTPFTRIGRDIIAPPTDLSYTAYIVGTGAFVRTSLNISWTPSPDPRVLRYELEVLAPGGDNNYELLKATNGVSHVIESVIDGTWSFRVRAFDALGTPSLYATLADVSVTTNSAPPDDVSDFAVSALVNTSLLTWSPVTNRNLSHYEIRYSSQLVTPDWNSAIVVAERVPGSATQQLVASRTGSFLIKAVTFPTVTAATGVYSVNAVHVSTDVNFMSSYTLETTLTEDSAFPGVLSDVEVVAGVLQLITTDTNVYIGTGNYTHHQIIDLGAVVNAVRVIPEVVVAGALATNSVDDWTDVDLITNVDGVTDGQWGLVVQVSTTSDDPIYHASNIITNPIEFNHASWTKTNCTITTDAGDGYDGTTTADAFVESSDGSPTQHSCKFTTTKAASALTTIFEVYLRSALTPGTDNYVILRISNNTGTNYGQATIDLDNGLFSTTVDAGTFTVDDGGCDEVGNGLYRAWVQVTTGTETNIAAHIYAADPADITDTSYTGSGRTMFHMWAAQLYYDTALYNPWSDYYNITAGDYNFRGIRFKTVFNSYYDPVTPAVEELAVRLEIPQVIQSGEDISTSSGADTTVTFDYEFKGARPSVVITPQGMATGDYVDLNTSNITSAGFTFSIRNSGGSRVVRTFDYHAKGTGIIV